MTYRDVEMSSAFQRYSTLDMLEPRLSKAEHVTSRSRNPPPPKILNINGSAETKHLFFLWSECQSGDEQLAPTLRGGSVNPFSAEN